MGTRAVCVVSAVLGWKTLQALALLKRGLLPALPPRAGRAAGTGPWRHSIGTEQMLTEELLEESSGKDIRPGNASGGSRLGGVGRLGRAGAVTEGCSLAQRVSPELTVLEVGGASRSSPPSALGLVHLWTRQS